MLKQRRKPLSIAVRRVLSGVVIAGTAASTPALTQAQDSQRSVEEIVVTGSRIATDPNLVTSSPVTLVRAEEIATRGVTRVEDLINDLPQITPEFTSTESNGATGTATLDLRGLNSERTLVLTNGHRMGFGDPFQLAPDINQVPGALIERVEVLTGGASSTYGSDAIAGVVNFIMKRDFEGVQIDYQYAGYQHSNDNDAVQRQIDLSGFQQAPSNPSDGGTTSFNIIFGTNTEDGKGNVTAYLGYRDINAIRQSERDFSACALSANDDGRSCAGSATIPTGLFTPFDGFAYYTVDGNDLVPWDGTYYNYGPLNYFQRPDERYTGGLFARYELNDHAEPYAEFQFMHDRSLAQIAPSGNFFVTSSISCDNPLLSAASAAAINALDNYARDPADPAITPDIPPGSPIEDSGPDGVADFPCAPGNGDTVPFYIGRRNVEGGPRIDDLRHTSFRGLAGMRGDLGTGWKYDAFANFSRLIYDDTYNNDMSVTRIGRALDVVTDPDSGQPVCRSTLSIGGAPPADPNCVPWNIFREGGSTQAAIDYLTLPLFADALLSMDQFVGFVSGDLGTIGATLPTANESVQVVFGAEYRGENFEFNPDQGFTSGDGAGQGGPIVAVDGSLSVKEIFTELRVPLVQDRPGIQSLALDLRYRYSDYSTDVTADAYNIGGEYKPVAGLMFRGGYSRAVRAANLRELYEPSNFGLWSGTDPCAGDTPLLTEAQCINAGLRTGQYGNVPVSPAGQYNGIFAGNVNLKPEESDSYTFGVVFNADQWVENLVFSVDYWSIEVNQAIDDNDAEFVITQCGLTADPAFCSLISRGPNGNLWIGQANVDLTRVNLGFYDTAGIDFSVAYRMELGLGTLGFNYRSTYLDKFDLQVSPGAAVNDCAGAWGSTCERPRPDYKHTFATTWVTPWDLTVVAAWRYISGVDELSTSADAFNAGVENYLDLSFTYSPQFAFGEGTTFNLGVQNVLDNDPPVNGRFGNVDTYGNGNTIPGTWDALGRYYFIGLTQSF